jgi:ADP-heptose:LPS heptosyltransferase
MHLAWAAGTPTIGFFSVTDPDEWGPYGDRNRAIVVSGRQPEWAAELALEVVDRTARPARPSRPM